MVERALFYKDLTLLQIRSFVAAARLGSLAAAARALGLAQPTVWKQIHALEALFERPLVETHARGCRLTAEGVALDRLFRPLVDDLDALPRRFEEAVRRDASLRIAASPRVIDEDLPSCIVDFRKHAPDVKLTLVTASNPDVPGLVASGRCDLGFTERAAVPEDPALAVDTVYALDVLLLAPRAHPLARARRLDPAAIAAHPMVTASSAFQHPDVSARLHALNVFATPAPVQALSAAGIRRYVALGFGVGILGTVLNRAALRSLTADGLRARSLSPLLGRIPIACIRRKAAPRSPQQRLFQDVVRRVMSAR